jgi:tetraacyldisaccharide 4'-kinase
MRPPEFWEKGGRRAHTIEALLAPASALYAWAGARRLRTGKPERIATPVICVGNVTLGGVGKTPIVRALAGRLRGQGVEAHALSRGYGGTLKGPLRVDPARHTAREVGDEPLLHAQDGPAWIARDRAAGARAAAAAGAQAILTDDGFQSPDIAKDLSILAFDAAAGLGNGRVFPSGPLREPVQNALARADLAILVGDGDAPYLSGFAGPVLRARLQPRAAAPAGPLIAFAGIGRPEKFFDTLTAMGAEISEALPFADHHAFTTADLALLDRYAAERQARLITTEKDFVRLPPSWRAHVASLPIEAVFTDDAPLDAALAALLARACEAQ